MKSKNIRVKKRNGGYEDLDLEKIHKVLFWACDGLSGVSVSDIEMNAHLQLVNGVTTKDIHDILIRAASDLITEKNPNYQFVASRLLVMSLRKQVLGKGLALPHLKEIMQNGVKKKVYDPAILSMYTEEEIETLNSYIKHDRDFKFPYAGIRQVIDKYLIQDRKTGEIYETPQFAYMMIGMTAFQNYNKIYDKATRLHYVKKFYDQVSKFKLSIPTPVIAGVRTPVKQYASCVGIDIGDDLDSIYASNHALGRLTAQRAGMGVNYGRLRSKGSKVRGGEVIHTGLIPFMKVTAATVKSCSQNGIRGGSATCHIPIWHPEIEDVIVLKNNKGTEENRIRTMDYSIQFWHGFWDRCNRDEEIFLFDPHDSKALYDAWGSETFESLYVEECKKKDKVRGKVSARELAKLFATERMATGRIYYMDIDNANNHSSFKDLVKFSNLCFSGDTMVAVADGRNAVSIRELAEQSGGKIKFPVYSASYDSNWNREIKNAVAFHSGSKEVIRVTLQDGGYFDCTSNHPIATPEGTYVEAGTLVSGQKIASNLDAMVQSVVPTGEVVEVFDLTVEDNHNFYIKPNSSLDELLVHNCQEINLPSEPIDYVNGSKGEIFTCILAAINLAETKFTELQEVGDVAVRFLDELIDIMEYAVPAAERFSRERRALGIGVIGLADLLAKEKVKYSDPVAPYVVAPFADEMARGLTKASIELAKIKGPCVKFNRTKYSDGILPIDTRSKHIDTLIPGVMISEEWEQIRKDLLEYGIRNSSLMAFMPAESSAVVSGTSNGVEPLRSLITTKTSKKGPIKSVAKFIATHAKYYELCWDSTYTNSGYLKVMAIFQMFADQGMSLNLYSDPRRYEGGLVSVGDTLGDIILAVKLGHKQLYYQNTLDLSGEEIIDVDGEKKVVAVEASAMKAGCAGDACAI